ncbi:hypothetical protein B2K_40355 [Paenibacillus mucilaginosus K02]|uniref:Uncharacterized protein n=1 Tax=Paenibacillus mucilaginosus K02 TaxID=997761 RepID=R9UQ73_9BACL|nr:hypothetical protein B2K_40355 [Paenibacillus mucilaginosus K02]
MYFGSSGRSSLSWSGLRRSSLCRSGNRFYQSGRQGFFQGLCL